MLRNYLTVAFRNLIRHKVHSGISIAGLAIGMACGILIFLFVQYELSYDRFHDRADRIYRVAVERDLFGKEIVNVPRVPFSMGPALKDAFPEIAQVTRMYTPGLKPYLVAHQDKRFYENSVLSADDHFFEVFTFPFAKGDPKTALAEPNCVVITRDMAEKYFGEEDPIGEVLDFVDFGEKKIVTGVIDNIPHNSHFRFDFLISRKIWFSAQDTEHLSLAYTYILLSEQASAHELARKFPEFVRTYSGAVMFREKYRETLFNPYLQPLTGIYLYSHLPEELGPNRDVADLWLFSSIAFLILIIACVNHMNLATACSANRAKEVGIRKVVGAHRTLLVAQFLGESCLLSCLSLLFAIALAEILLPPFSAFLGKELEMASVGSVPIWLGLTGVVVLVTVLAGGYPAFFLSTFQPVAVLKGALKMGSGGRMFRKTLVIFQFGISISLIALTSAMYSQLTYMKHKRLGFDKDQLIVAPLKEFGESRVPLVKEELSRHHGILGITGVSDVPGRDIGTHRYTFADGRGSQEFEWKTLFVDYDFIKTLGIELKYGRDFLKQFAADKREAFILNETAVKQLGWVDAVGVQVEAPYLQEWKGSVIGVVQDFHFRSLHHRIEPVVLRIHPSATVPRGSSKGTRTSTTGQIVVRVHPENIPGTLAFLKQKWAEFSPRYPLEYSFLNEDFEAMYRTETRLSQIFGIFSLLAIFIACLGLFGLASFVAESRTKEIGIRKVLGATASSIVLLLSKDFLKPVAMANLIALPVSYFAMEDWLKAFAYRVDLSIGVFVLVGMLALSIALLSVGCQAMKAALSRPVNTLRYE